MDCLFRNGWLSNPRRNIPMVDFAIIELEDGLTVVELRAAESPEEAAARERGVLVDPGPYPTYEDACDALAELEGDDEEA